MSRSGFNWFGLMVASFFLFTLSLLGFSGLVSLGANGVDFKKCFSMYICLDGLSCFLVVLTGLITICVVFLKPWLSVKEFFFVLLSQVFAVLSYICTHAFFFWAFYEMSILLLLYLLLCSSPYSERYSAFWYFLFYLGSCSVPLFVIFLLVARWFNDYNCASWDFGSHSWECGALLGLLFITKIPLFPFHSWLPVVHAESSSVVSVCLSGYIMKLGVLGLVRFCSWVLPSEDYLFYYCSFLVLVSLVFYFFSVSELDVKRWLAFLSLCHIVIVPVCLLVCDSEGYVISFSYCLGHALSASMAFILFWFLSGITGSRCWFVFKSGLSEFYVLPIFVVSTICFCGSLPFCLQFFCELYVVCESLSLSFFLMFSLIIYLFFSALVPLVCVGYVLTRYRDVKPFLGISRGPFIVLGFLCFINAFIFLFF